MTALPDPVSKPEFYRDVTTKRLFAWMLDVVLITVITTVVCILTLGLGFFIFLAIYAVVGFLYRWLTISNRSATWGMRFMSIELREQDGGALSSGTALLHTLGYTVSVATAMVQPVSIVMMLLSERNQGLSDMVLNTAMVNRAAPSYR